MITSFGSCAVFLSSWTQFKTNIASRVLSIQYDDDGLVYTVFAYDMLCVYACNIWKGTVPDRIINGGGYAQATNDADKSDFETNYKPYANRPIDQYEFTDPRRVHRFGNLTSTSASEVLVCARGYAEPASQAQRSIVSTSAQDSDGAGTGLRQVRITYLDSNYVLKTEDVLTNGTGAVNTAATDIRFIESLVGIKGTDAVGAVKLMSASAGGGTEICGIGAGTQDAFLCHHYVPAGMRAFVRGWGATVSLAANLKLKGQTRFGSNLVDNILDLDNILVVAGAGNTFYTEFGGGMAVGEKTYVRVVVAPGSASSTITRAYLDLWEDKAVL